MSKRIGKYKVDKRTSEISLMDGGTVSGDLTVTGGITVTADGTNNYVPWSTKYITAVGNQDYSSLTAGNWLILVNVALADTNYIRLPEATTANGGMQIKVIFGLAPADNAYVGFKTSVITGGVTTISDATAGQASTNSAYQVSAHGTTNHSLVLDANGHANDGIGEAGTELNFYYPGVENRVIYRGNGIGDVDSATLSNHFSTTEVDGH